MSAYHLNKIFYLVDVDQGFLTAFKNAPADAIRDFELTEAEREAVLSGNIAALYRMGVHTFLLTATVRHGLSGVTREAYERQIKS